MKYRSYLLAAVLGALAATYLGANLAKLHYPVDYFRVMMRTEPLHTLQITDTEGMRHTFNLAPTMMFDHRNRHIVFFQASPELRRSIALGGSFDFTVNGQAATSLVEKMGDTVIITYNGIAVAFVGADLLSGVANALGHLPIESAHVRGAGS